MRQRVTPCLALSNIIIAMGCHLVSVCCTRQLIVVISRQQATNK
jgi:hypothetical protein